MLPFPHHGFHQLLDLADLQQALRNRPIRFGVVEYELIPPGVFVEKLEDLFGDSPTERDLLIGLVVPDLLIVAFQMFEPLFLLPIVA